MHIAHNGFIDEDTRIAASVTIAGSVKIGRRVTIWIGSAIRDGVVIGDRAEVLINSVVVKDVAEGEIVGGFYAIDKTAWFNKLRDEYRKYVVPLRERRISQK